MQTQLSPVGDGSDDDPGSVLSLVIHPDPDVGMGQIGHLQAWYGPLIRRARVQV